MAKLEWINGMFASGLWGSGQGDLSLVRDRLGIKTLDCGAFRCTLAFESDVRALVRLTLVHRDLNPFALACYLLHQYVSGEQFIWQGVQRLLPGHLLDFDVATGKSLVKRRWSLPLELRDCSPEEALHQFTQLFERSVRDCLVINVPLGVFLSGSYDSSAVARASLKASRDLRTFSIGCAGYAQDEHAAAAQTAAVLGTRH